ncbi:C40 family peptidase [Streptomyces benahoarensis]|uniref:Glycoside hydrolase n=1 Tax=Streptomyces benahoarensis TaxID=2595054 RepID=A0A553Z478_9ACTN|nr:C40 family peptidase [Streptomyces benahoarensis]TSB20483.1 glycoside hydrolase [Streptomyces benahoarensis]TSB36073.1 glycoside hydrolase [Streptomyces benahoarensis]
MPSHRKPRTRVLTSPGSRRTAAGLTTAALATVTLLSQSAEASPRSPKPTVEEVKKKVDTLYRQAEVATQKYNGVKERVDERRAEVGDLQDAAARRTGKLNEARRELGTFAAAQYRGGGMNPTAQLMFSKDPQQFADRSHLMERLTGRQQQAVDAYQEQQAAAAHQRAEATRSLERLQESQTALADSKRTVQGKLTEARQLLSELTAQEKAHLAELERKKEEEARRKAEEEAQKQREQPSGGTDTGSPGTTDPGQGGGPADGSYHTKAEKALAFARAQMGKPYVWGATGPNSYDCSGLTQAAWKAAGVSLPRTTWDQVKVGQRVVTKDLAPGDLVFFYNDISHVGMYIGGGKMIHAPKPGASVRIESIYYMPIYGSVRPA